MQCSFNCHHDTVKRESIGLGWWQTVCINSFFLYLAVNLAVSDTVAV